MTTGLLRLIPIRLGLLQCIHLGYMTGTRTDLFYSRTEKTFVENTVIHA